VNCARIAVSPRDLQAQGVDNETGCAYAPSPFIRGPSCGLASGRTFGHRIGFALVADLLNEDLLMQAFVKDQATYSVPRWRQVDA
jgi:hypothetical protein